jgi:hypothetical protein
MKSYLKNYLFIKCVNESLSFYLLNDLNKIIFYYLITINIKLILKKKITFINYYFLNIK